MTDQIPLKRRDATSLGQFEPGDRIALNYLGLSQGYIDGLVIEWLSANSLRVSSGAAFVPSANSVVALPAAATLSGLSLTANTWYHVYLTAAGGVEAVATAPAAPYFGTARAKTGDNTRRYVGSVRTSASGAIFKFRHSDQQIIYMVSTELAPFVVLSGIVPVSPATASASASSVVPITSKTAIMMNLNASTNSFLLITNSDGPTVPGFIAFVPPDSTLAMTTPLASDQSLSCAYQSTGSSLTVVLRVYGYTFER